MAGPKNFLAAGLIGLIMGFGGFGFPGPGSAEERYVVRPGDSLYAISKARGVSIEALKRANQLKRDQIKPRQVLLIPTPGIPGTEQTHPSNPLESGEDEIDNSSLHEDQEVIVHRPAAEDEGELRDGEPLSTPAVRDGEEAKEPPAQPLGKWTTSEERSILVRVAKTFLGVPYRLGGSTLRGLDCSALVRKVYEIFEISLPRTAREQSGVGKSVDRDELEQGDLVFFKTRRSQAGHVGIYIGEGEFVHASSYQRKVKVDRLDAPYFSKRFLRGVRVKELEREI